MLLEEAALHLLRRSGYRTVDAPGTDPTLCKVGAGLAVRGRGTEHQIDAIADFVVHHPFSNQQRLLVESKCYGLRRSVDVEVVRNAIGVLKDVSEFWAVGPTLTPGRQRYHYQLAIFSTSPFSSGAQKYAFAHDIYLFPLHRSRYFQPILESIRRIAPPQAVVFPIPAVRGSQLQLSELRRFVREWLRRTDQPRQIPRIAQQIDVRPFIEACHRLNFVLVGVLGGRFSILLTPSDEARDELLNDEIHVRIYWDDQGWYLRRQDSDRNLFSFDLPDELFDLYAMEGRLTPERALELKENLMSSFQAIETRGGRYRIINFKLDLEWIEAIRRRAT